MQLRRLIAGVTGGLAALGCAARKSGETGESCGSGRIVTGGSKDTLLHLDEKQLRALTLVEVPPTSTRPSAAYCSAVVVAPGLALTARHCLDRDADGEWDPPAGGGAPYLSLFFGVLDPSTPSARIERAWLHPELDVALLEVPPPESIGLELAPIPPLADALDDTWLGSPVELAGFGRDAEQKLGALAFVVEPIVAVSIDHFVVNGGGRTGACEGDSGSPALGRASDGRAAVLGILENGDASCVGDDNYARVDRLLDWKPFRDRLSGDEAPYEACEGLAPEGECLRGRAMWCDTDLPRADDCTSAGEICGWSAAAAGFRCVDAADDPCAGLGSFATCAGEEVVACSAGALVRSSCRCGATCVPWFDGDGAACE